MFWSYMGDSNNEKIEKLQCTFPKLTEMNQEYVLGFSEGLRYAQDKGKKPPGKVPPLPQAGVKPNGDKLLLKERKK